jgi:ComF family protein
MLKDLYSLLFPELCSGCGNSLMNNERAICSLCEYRLPKTNYHLQAGNALEKMFYGRVHIVSASAIYLFNKGGLIQNIIHNIKYKGQKNVGYIIGLSYGKILIENAALADLDIILPVPLHSTRMRKRGYNQSEYFAKGLAKSMNVKMVNDILLRDTTASSQTNKSRFERWKNVEDAFLLKQANTLEGKHVLLVDDVVTTGSTIEGCANKLQEVKDVKVSVVAIAHTIF